MILGDITNVVEQRSVDRKEKCEAPLQEERPEAPVEGVARSRALEQENLLLRAEVEKLRADFAKALAASGPEPRTPRRRAASAAPPLRTPRATTPSGSATPQTPGRSCARQLESRVPLTPRTPRTPRQRSCSLQDDETKGRASAPATPRQSPPPLPGSRPELGKPVRRRPTAPTTIAPALAAKGTGCSQPRQVAKVPNTSLSSRPKAAPKAAATGRAAWANALWEQQRREEAAYQAIASRKAAISELRCRREQVLQRTSHLELELQEATTGHPERIAALSESISAASSGLKAALEAAAQEEQSQQQMNTQYSADQDELQLLQGELAALQARELAEGAGRRKLVAREEELGAAAERARADHEARAAVLAEGGLVARRLNNEILSLKGNVRVFCRLRSQLCSEESSEALRVDVHDDSQTLTVYGAPQLSVTGLNEQTRSWDFEFDHVFRQDASQSKVFEEIALLVQSALDGYRVAILAYGQTGSGKTHTMAGPNAPEADEEGAGMIPRSVDLIFKEVEQLQQNGWEFEVHAAVAEVYNDTVLDLLATSRQACAGSESWEQPSFRRVRVRDAPAVHTLLRKANRERHVAATAANERSSRSHFVFQLSILGQCKVAGQEREVSGLLSFVDLAGSERLERTGAVGERLKEAQHINRSLCALGDVIEAIGRKGSARSAAAAAIHVPYRNSRLTMLLRDSLGGDSKTLMFANVSPLQDHCGETLSSLRFASKVHACTVGVAKRNAVESGSS
eukprot:TRINITY_DN5732_c0_g1_i1.p1 TRINITY_DN5732_c0_g1~~TRINITY_DN5732_c0_g1_i1.p1  ORF type:complete len:744 (-),score=169.01 TRINITY_DN5732_c0_g1_i1:144-2375(-)